MTKEYKYFTITNIVPDFAYMGVSREEHDWTNGNYYLLEDGIFYGKDDFLDDNERVISTWELPDWFNQDSKNDYAQVREDMHQLMLDRFGVFSESYDIQLFTEEDNQEMLNKNPKYIRTVDDQTRLRFQILDSLDKTKSLLREVKDEKVKSTLLERIREVA